MIDISSTYSNTIISHVEVCSMSLMSYDTNKPTDSSQGLAFQLHENHLYAYCCECAFHRLIC